jgi:hypothetical protein
VTSQHIGKKLVKSSHHPNMPSSGQIDCFIALNSTLASALERMEDGMEGGIDGAIEGKIRRRIEGAGHFVYQWADLFAF